MRVMRITLCVLVIFLLSAVLLSGCKAKRIGPEWGISRPTFPRPEETILPTKAEDPPQEHGGDALYKSEQQGFSFLYDSAYTVEWNERTGATIYIENPGEIPYVQIYRGIGVQETFDKDTYFADVIDWVTNEYGDRLVSSVILDYYDLPGKRFEGGAAIQYTADHGMVEMLVLTEEKPDSVVQYISRYYVNQEKETLKALKKAVNSYQQQDGFPGKLEEGRQGEAPGQGHQIRLLPYDGGYFSLMLPEGWQLYIMGQYSSFGFRAWDPMNPDYEIFYYGSIDPLNKSYDSKEVWKGYIGFYGYPQAEQNADAPVVDIYSASSLFYTFRELQALSDKHGFGFSFPALRGFAPLQTIPVHTAFGNISTDEALLFASVTGSQGGDCRGKFYSSLHSTGTTYVGGVDMSPAGALNVTGVIAPKEAFKEVEGILTEAVSSLRFSDQYLQDGADYARAVGQAAMADNEARWAVFDACLQNWHSQFLGDD
ncbi:MAG: hypothetical protein GX809_01400 [Clostridiaceae bacterium]|jgi:hypothetical protein|nr:hypothetical protein [Clostridiaceae bacterium]